MPKLAAPKVFNKGNFVFRLALVLSLVSPVSYRDTRGGYLRVLNHIFQAKDGEREVSQILKPLV
jgi:hypothetical protein